MPLNPTLYETLETKCGHVRVTNDGEARVVHYSPDPQRPGHLRTTVRQRGEQYAVNCPCCNDSRQRCYVSYQYGERDPRTGSANHHLWYCHNEKCHQDPVNRARLQAMLTPSLAGQARAQRRKADQAKAGNPAPAPTPQPIAAPEGRTPVDQLLADHPASQYLIGRGFDLAELSAVWGVCWVHSCRNTRPNAEGRIAFPILRPEPPFSTAADAQTVLAGWQARIIPGIQPAIAPDARYLSAAGMQKSSVLYGLPQARQATGPVLIAEGPTDVWRVGPGAVALLGKSMSTTQRALLVQNFPGRPIVVMLDSDARKDALEIQRQLQAARRSQAGDNRVVLAELPVGTDPADHPRDELHAIVADALSSKPHVALAQGGAK